MPVRHVGVRQWLRELVRRHSFPAEKELVGGWNGKTVRCNSHVLQITFSAPTLILFLLYMSTIWTVQSPSSKVYFRQIKNIWEQANVLLILMLKWCLKLCNLMWFISDAFYRFLSQNTKCNFAFTACFKTGAFLRIFAKSKEH